MKVVRQAAFISWLTALAAACGCQDPPRDEVIVYVAVDRKDAEAVLLAFEVQSGLHVRAVYDAEAAKTTGLVTRLVAEAERPRCDVFWNNEFVQTMQLAERGLLSPYASPSAADIPVRYKDPGDRWCGQAARARVIVYNSDHLDIADVPRSLSELAEPRWRGKFAIADPQFGTTRTHAAALFAALGPEQAQRLLTELVKNEPHILAGNALVVNVVARANPGPSSVLVGLTDTDDVRSGQADGHPVEVVFPDQDGLGTLLIPTTVCLIRDGPNPAAAQRLADFLLGDEAERMLTADGTGYHSLRPGRGDSGLAGVKPLDASFVAVFEQLEPSTRWTATHFRP